ncbi:hypothetical protein HQ520_05475 [bacterium]|nr:hypothetical protein [bacterium]
MTNTETATDRDTEISRLRNTCEAALLSMELDTQSAGGCIHDCPDTDCEYCPHREAEDKLREALGRPIPGLRAEPNEPNPPSQENPEHEPHPPQDRLRHRDLEPRHRLPRP